MKYICIDRHAIRARNKSSSDPVITVLEGKPAPNPEKMVFEQIGTGDRVEIKGPSKVMFSDDPLEFTHCGARAWIETDAEVVID